MEKEDITRAAEGAIGDLQLDCTVTEITRPMGKNTWCIQFSGSFGQLCDEFHDKTGKENSSRVVREKIKRFFLKQRKPTRIVRGRPSSTRSVSAGGGENLLGTLLSVGQQAIEQASRITSEVVERATNLNQAVLKSQADMIEGISPTAAEMIRPETGGGARRTTGPPPQRMVEPVSHEVDVEARSEKRKRATKDSRSRPTKKAATKGAAAKKTGKGATGKRSAKAKTGKAGGKKSTGKSRR